MKKNNLDIDKYIVTENMTVKDVMKVIDNNTAGIAFVCDNKRLLAAISDGDIRRGLLNNNSLELKVKDVANYKPLSVKKSLRDKATSIMRRNAINAIPILDEDGLIIDIEFLLKSNENKGSMSECPLVIMAGGKGTRLKPYSDILPKPLFPIGDKTITEHIADRFIKSGCDDIYMIVNYHKQLIKSYFNDINFNINFLDEEEYLGTGGGLILIKDYIDNTFFFTNCDILVEANYNSILKNHKEKGNIITIVCADKKVIMPYGTVDIDNEGRVKQFIERPDISMYINTGLYVIEPEFVEKIPENTFINITETIEKCIADGLRVGIFVVGEEAWLDMGQLDELEKMKKILCD